MTTRPRRVLDRSIILARCRWECLRRTAAYRTDIAGIIRDVAASRGWTEDKLEWDCRENGAGVLEPGRFNDQYYHELCARYGLVVLVHPVVSFSEAEMAAFPIFADTPGWQPKVKDQAALRRFARRGGELDRKSRRGIFARARVPAGPFRLDRKKRLHLGRFDRTLAVFDARVAGKPFTAIATVLGLSLHQVKRAWKTARYLIPNWLDLEPHFDTCPTCLACIREKRDRWCAAAELQIGLPPTGRSRSRTSGERLDILAAHQGGLLPARRSMKRIDSSPDS
jgi:hypothetical protein